jgi:hypothetical protein
VDEKSQIQALDWTAPMLPLPLGIPERQTHDYRPPRHRRAVRRALLSNQLRGERINADAR